MSWVAHNIAKEKHCFFGADGGVSSGKYSTLNTNLSSQDQHDHVLQNIDFIAQKFQLHRENMATVRQSVSNTAIFIDKPTWYKIAADGIVTTQKNILLCIKTADCAPVLFYDERNQVIGAAHAGWRGAYKGIVENVLALMLKHGAKINNIHAAIGPCLQQESFEVQDDMRQLFLQISPAYEKYFVQTPHGFQFALSLFLEDKMHHLGIHNICNSGIDTYAPDNGYFSYRRYTHLNLIDCPYDYPTQYSVITL